MEVRDGRCFRHKTGDFGNRGDKVVDTGLEGGNGGREWRGLGEYLSAAEVELGKDEKSRIRSSGCPVFDTNGGFTGSSSESVVLWRKVRTVVSCERMRQVLCCFGGPVEVQTSSGTQKLGSDPVTGAQRHCDDDLCRAEVELFSAWARHEQCGLRSNLFCCEAFSQSDGAGERDGEVRSVSPWVCKWIGQGPHVRKRLMHGIARIGLECRWTWETGRRAIRRQR